MQFQHPLKMTVFSNFSQLFTLVQLKYLICKSYVRFCLEDKTTVLGLVWLEQVSLDQLGQVRSGQVTSGQVTSGQVTSGQVTSGQVRLGQVSKVKLDQLKLMLSPIAQVDSEMVHNTLYINYNLYAINPLISLPLSSALL